MATAAAKTAEGQHQLETAWDESPNEAGCHERRPHDIQDVDSEEGDQGTAWRDDKGLEPEEERQNEDLGATLHGRPGGRPPIPGARHGRFRCQNKGQPRQE